MDIDYPAFGKIIIEGIQYDHDVVIDTGRIGPRDKRPSKKLRSHYGHTPLSEREQIPWSQPRLIIGSGYSGRLPIAPGVHAAAVQRGVTLEIMPTKDACSLLSTLHISECNAILHVTC